MKSRPPDAIAATVAAALLLATLCGCARFGPVKGVDACAEADSWGRHHSRFLLGPRVRWEGGAEARLMGGHQQPIWTPGEPHYSSRAPSDEFQVHADLSIPIWER